MIRLILADDHKLMREGIKSLLEKYKDIEIIAETENGLDTAELAKKLVPEIVIMDLSMPIMGGIESTMNILSDNPQIKIIVLTMHSDRRFMAEAIKAGAAGYLLKDCAFDELVNAIHAVMEGKTYISHSLTDSIVKDYLEKVFPEEKNSLSQLTEKEMEVFRFIVEGKNSKDISGLLNLSIKTIETHRTNLMEKLKIFSVAELTKLAIKEGVIKI